MSEYTPYISALRSTADELETDLALWEARDPDKPGHMAKGARKDALRLIDAAITGLYRLRGQLAPGIRLGGRS